MTTHREGGNAQDAAAVGVIVAPEVREQMKIHGRYKVEIFRPRADQYKRFDRLRREAEVLERHGLIEEATGRRRIMATLLEATPYHSEEFDNLVTTVGKNYILDNSLAGSSFTTGTVYLGMKGSGTAAAGDTMASHSGWSELNISSSSGVRQALTWSAASAGSKAATAVSFTISTAGPTTVAGCFIVAGGTSANGNTTGTLVSAGDFAASRSVSTNDVVNITYSVGL